MQNTITGIPNSEKSGYVWKIENFDELQQSYSLIF